MAAGLVQTILLRRGQSLMPALGGFRPTRPNVMFRTRSAKESAREEPADPGEAPTKLSTRVLPADHPYGPTASSGDRTP
jgi:hypothetical protein